MFTALSAVGRQAAATDGDYTLLRTVAEPVSHAVLSRALVSPGRGDRLLVRASTRLQDKWALYANLLIPTVLRSTSTRSIGVEYERAATWPPFRQRHPSKGPRDRSSCLPECNCARESTLANAPVTCLGQWGVSSSALFRYSNSPLNFTM
jgi:hypothetical protein